MSQVPHAAPEREQVLLRLRGGRDGCRHAGRQYQRDRGVDAAPAAAGGREVQDRAHARQGRDGRGLSRPRLDARTRSRDQGAAARHHDGRAYRQTLPAGGEDIGEARPHEYHPDLPRREIFVWSSFADVFASCWKRLTICSSIEMSGGSTLIATSRSSVRSCARKTAPMPPLPSRRSILYFPSTSRCRRCINTSVPLALAPSVPPPVTSAPHARQNLLPSGSGVWHLRHSIVDPAAPVMDARATCSAETDGRLSRLPWATSSCCQPGQLGSRSSRSC